MRLRDFTGAAVRSVALGVALVALVCAAQPARAMDVTCVEASRYKHLYRIFDNDPARFAAFFGIDVKRLPHPETCRAVLITGPIEPAARDGSENDFDRLLAAIRGGEGWLATLYLASPGGNVAMGLRLGQLTRMFWLSAHAVDGPTFDYVPDFLGTQGPGSPASEIPPGLERGWRDYVAATQAIAKVSAGDGKRRRCASACTFIQAGAIHRYGQSYFHRARRSARPASDGPGNPPQPEPSMSDILERLQKIEALIVAFFRQMDAGESAIQAYQSTATQTTLSAYMPPIPRYIDDHLRGVCTAKRQPGAPQAPRQRSGGLPHGLLTGIEAQEQSLPSGPPPQIPPSHGPQQQINRTAVNHATNQCVAASNASERVTQFGKLCANGCDRMTLYREATRRISALTPSDPAQRPNSGPPQRSPGSSPSPRAYPPQGSPGSPQRGYPPGSYPPGGR